jgi:hypothetical protein
MNKQAENKKLYKSLIDKGYQEINNVLYRPDQVQQMINNGTYTPKKKKRACNRLKTGWIDDSLNIKNKAGQIDQFISLCKQVYHIDVWPEFYFTIDKQYRFDYAIPIHNGNDTRLAIEVEGGIYMRGASAHSSGTGIARDMDKSTHAAANGWRIIRVQPSQLLTTDTINKIIQSLT